MILVNDQMTGNDAGHIAARATLDLKNRGRARLPAIDLSCC